MTTTPSLRFLSLFVPNLEEAQQRYEAIFEVKGIREDRTTPSPHPFASDGPVVFDLGSVKLALYQCDQRATHPGDVGIGLEIDGAVEEIARRAAAHQGQVFFGPTPLANDGRKMAVFMLPDRHFFEVITKKEE